MISLLVLDHHSYWTGLGAVLKFGGIALVVVLGVALFLYSRVYYFTTFWIPLAFVPQIILSATDTQTHRICMEVGRVIPCNGRHFLWLTIAMVEIALIWVPICGAMARAYRKQPNPTVELDARDGSARGSP